MTAREVSYLDLQARTGITKHIGGPEATDALIEMCHIEGKSEVLYVGCGIGVGPAHIAKKRGCRVVGVDISETMLAWARLRAREDGVADKVDIRYGDILDLPFEDGRFGAVIVESVAVFVEDKARAIAECVRVARTGGYVGMNEVFWVAPASAEFAADARREMGADLLPVADWRALWEASGLAERVIEVRSIDPRAEVRARLRWVGGRWALRAFGRLVALYVTSPPARRAMMDQLRGTRNFSPALGYGLFAGRKWADNLPHANPSTTLR